MEGRPRAQPRPRGAVVSLPPRPRARDLTRLLPSGRSLVAGFAIVGGALGLYLCARVTPMFAIRTLDVQGAPPALARQVRAALGPVEGRSLLALGGDEVEQRVRALPGVYDVSYDRNFPHTLRIVVVPERAAAVLRQGAAAWLVSARGRVLRSLGPHAHPSLPRIWLPKDAAVSLGATLPDAEGGRAVRAVAPLARARFPARVRFVRSDERELTLVLRSGRELRLGDASDLALKLAIAAKILPMLAGPGYLDVSVPERPVATTNPQVGG